MSGTQFGNTSFFGGITQNAQRGQDLAAAVSQARAYADAAAASANLATGNFAKVATTGAYVDLVNKPTLSTVAGTGAYNDLLGRPAFATVSFTGAYADLAGRPILSTVASTGSYSDLVGRPALSTVASSGAYGDLTGRPTLAAVAASGAYADIVGKPVLAVVATSGAYLDLTGRPTLSTVAGTGAYGDLTGRPALSPVATSGAYGDLSGKPSLAPVATSGSYGDLTNVPGWGQSVTTPNAPFTFSSGEAFGRASRNTTITGNTILQGVIGAGATQADMVQGVLEVAAGTTITQAHAVGGYVKNSNPRAYAGGGGVEIGCGVVYGGAGWAAADGADVWGLAIALTDIGGGQGSQGRILTNELDFNVNYTNTQVCGIALTGASGAQPTKAEGFMVASLGPGAVWTVGHGTYDGVAAVAYRAGRAKVAGNARPSQPIRLASSGSDGVVKDVGILATAGNTLNVEAGGGTAHLAVGSGLLSRSMDIVNLTAAMVDQGTGYVISKNVTFIGTAPSGSSVTMKPSASLPQGVETPFMIYNGGANDVRVYPGSGDAFLGQAANALLVLPAGGQATAWYLGAGTTLVFQDGQSKSQVIARLTGALPATSGFYAGTGSAGAAQAMTNAQISAAMLTWLQSLPTTSSGAAQWWNNGGIPAYS